MFGICYTHLLILDISFLIFETFSRLNLDWMEQCLFHLNTKYVWLITILFLVECED